MQTIWLIRIERSNDDWEKNIYLQVYLILFIFPFQFFKLKLQI